MIGEVIGSYRVVGELGKGGMGVVYRAEHVQLGRPAALKMLLPQLSTDASLVQRFFNEARTTSTIDHPGIVEIYDFGTHTDGRAYIVMALLKGESLEHRLRHGTITPIEGATIMAQAVGALGAAHARGIVHRDLKPDNLFLVPNELMADGIQVKLLDFGIAKLADEQQAGFKTQTGALMGTPAYMSPEQCMGRSDLDHRTDLYSMGCILFHILCGRPPFTSDHGTGVMIAAHIRDAAPDPRTINPQVPPALANIVTRLLEKEPSARFQTAHELRTALIAAGANAPATLPSAQTIPARPSAAPRYTGADAYLATTAPTTTSGSAAQIASTPLTAVKSPSRVGIFLGIGAVLVAAGGIAAYVVMSGTEPPPASPPAAIAPVAASQPAASPPPPAASPPPPPTHPPPMIDAGVAELAACPPGQARTDDTRGNCCWPDQAWSLTKQRCVGTPKCPAGMVRTSDRCEDKPVVAVEGAKPIPPQQPTGSPGSPTPRDKQRFSVAPKARAGGQVTIRFPVALHALPGERFWITIVEKSIADRSWGSYEYVPDGARSIQLPVPSTAGEYEIRLHANYPKVTTNVVHRAPVQVDAE